MEVIMVVNPGVTSIHPTCLNDDFRHQFPHQIEFELINLNMNDSSVIICVPTIVIFVSIVIY